MFVPYIRLPLVCLQKRGDHTVPALISHDVFDTVWLESTRNEIVDKKKDPEGVFPIGIDWVVPEERVCSQVHLCCFLKLTRSKDTFGGVVRTIVFGGGSGSDRPKGKRQSSEVNSGKITLLDSRLSYQGWKENFLTRGGRVLSMKVVVRIILRHYKRIWISHGCVKIKVLVATIKSLFVTWIV